MSVYSRGMCKVSSGLRNGEYWAVARKQGRDEHEIVACERGRDHGAQTRAAARLSTHESPVIWFVFATRWGGVCISVRGVAMTWHPRITAESCEVVCCQHSRAVTADMASMGSSSSSFASADVVCMTWQRSRQGWGGLFDGCRRCW